MIKIKGYSHTSFSLINDIDKLSSEAFKTENFIEYIRLRCLYHYLNCLLIAFSGRKGTLVPEKKLFCGNSFPTEGKSHDYLVFKKINKIEVIPELNQAIIEFYDLLKIDFIKINDNIFSYSESIRNMTAVDRVHLFEKIKNKYSGADGFSLFEQVHIYEDDYLHGQFDRFKTFKDFDLWWKDCALPLLNTQ